MTHPKRTPRSMMSESYERVMKFNRIRRPMVLVKKIEKDLAELKGLLRTPIQKKRGKRP